MNYIRRQLGNIAGTVFTNWLACVFYFMFPLLYDIKVSGLHNYTASPSTLVTINHKRDLDIIIATPILHLRRTLFKNKLRMHFIARDDLFDPGFLSAHFLIPGLVGRIIHRVNIAVLMRAFRAHPISHLVQKRMAPLLRDVIQVAGDLKLGEVVRRGELEELARLSGKPHVGDISELSVTDFLGYDYCAFHQQFSDVGILQEGLSQKVRKYSLEVIGKQLQVFADILDEGGICLLAPEGHLSPDGRFWPVKSGLYRLLSMTREDTRILPVNTTYDFMTRGRMRVYVGIGEEIIGPRELRKTALEKLVQRSIIGLGPVTMGQLGSDHFVRKLEEGNDTVHLDELAEELALMVERLDNDNLRLDDRLKTEASFNRRLHDFIGYCLDKKIISELSPGTYIINREEVINDKDFWHRENPVEYSSNEIRSLREILR